MKLYKYSGTIEEFAVERGRISYIKLFDVTDFDKAPTRLEVFGALGKYIEAIEGTDAEERYIKSDWYFDSNLYLRRIEIPGGEVGRPAKIITQSPDNIDQLEIFGHDGRLELVQLPDKLDEAHEMDATNWFLNHHYLKSYNSPYDCTGQEFTNWFYLFRRRGHWFAYHSVSRDV